MNNIAVKIILFLVNIILTGAVRAQVTPLPVWQNNSFAIYRDSVVQDAFTARVISRQEITSDYKSPSGKYKSPSVQFKFSINGNDNEMVTGRDHHYNIISASGRNEVPLIRFGQQYIDSSTVPDGFYLPANSEVLVQLDMRHVLSDFDAKGYYQTYSGEKIFKEDFKGVYVAGSTLPMIWDFENLVNHPVLKLEDKEKDGIYEVKLLLNAIDDAPKTAAGWKLTKDISSFPQYHSEYPLSDALYNLALEEMQNAIEADSTLRTGKEWAGVWTRDVSYSIILSMAYLQPQAAMNSLLRKVNKKKRIIQDTGTGGAWPVSTDRIIWAVAAWEIYKATLDKNWLSESYAIIKNTIDDDMQVAYDFSTGLMKGESSFLDWREQTYPKWMEPADIFESECLGTNAVFYEAIRVLARMSAILGKSEDASQYMRSAEKIKKAINQQLWMNGKGYYGQYLYGRNNKILSPRSEALGEALTVLFDIADKDRQKKIISKVPVLDFGIPCIFPQIPNTPPYHNNAVWPFVQSFWAMAAAKSGNERSVMESISAIYRPAALFLTNKENFTAADGDFAGTQINSSNMLWSLSGSIAIIHKVLFGIHFNDSKISFHPFVPYALNGNRSLSNFKYKDVILDIELNGYGNVIKSFLIDGKPSSPFISAALRGRHKIVIDLASKKTDQANTNRADQQVSLPAPSVKVADNVLTWSTIQEAVEYRLVKNGKEIAGTKDTMFRVMAQKFAQYQVIAVDKNGYSSFATEPVVIAGNGAITIVELENFIEKSLFPYKGYSGDGFVETGKKVNTVVDVPVEINEEGEYLVDFRYANGNGPVNTDNKCAIRTVSVHGNKLGTIVFPHRGRDEWSNWGWSNAIRVHLKKGPLIVTVSLESYNENMNGDINQAMLDCMRLTKIN